MQFSRPNWSWSFEVIKIRVWRQNNWYYATVIKPCCFFFLFFFRCLNSTASAFLHKQCRPICRCCVDSALCFHLCLCGFFFFEFFKRRSSDHLTDHRNTHTHTHTRWRTILGTFSWCEWTLEALMSLPVSWFFLTGWLTLLSWWTNIYPDTS